MRRLDDRLVAHVEARARLRRGESLVFPPDPGCYGCLGTGTLQGFGSRPGTPCSCVHHESGECEPGLCSPLCRALAEARGDR